MGHQVSTFEAHEFAIIGIDTWKIEDSQEKERRTFQI